MLGKMRVSELMCPGCSKPMDDCVCYSVIPKVEHARNEKIKNEPIVHNKIHAPLKHPHRHDGRLE